MDFPSFPSSPPFPLPLLSPPLPQVNCLTTAWTVGPPYFCHYLSSLPWDVGTSGEGAHMRRSSRPWPSWRGFTFLTGRSISQEYCTSPGYTMSYNWYAVMFTVVAACWVYGVLHLSHGYVGSFLMPAGIEEQFIQRLQHLQGFIQKFC